MKNTEMEREMNIYRDMDMGGKCGDGDEDGLKWIWRWTWRWI